MDDAPTTGRLGRYVLYESLGSGGMGEVHRARAYAAEGVVKDLCIKRIRAQRLARPEATERFVAEARLCMRLAHGNIVPVFDFGRVGDEYYLAMEWVDGADLRRLLAAARRRGEPLAPAVAAHVGAEVARALAYAHELPDEHGRAVVHGDVKPGNVLVSRAGDVKLGDFGVATAVGSTGRGGTRGYMPPEQERGEALGPQADLFALGVVLGEMLTLEAPVAGGPEEGAPVPDALRPWLERLLSPEPAERPTDAREVAVALEEHVGRSRAEGGGAPRDALVRLVAEAEEAGTEPGRRSQAATVELGPEASYVRDGLTDGFVSRMGVTTATRTGSEPASEGASGEAASAPEPNGDARASEDAHREAAPASAPRAAAKGRGRARWLAPLAVALALGAAAWVIRGQQAQPAPQGEPRAERATKAEARSTPSPPAPTAPARASAEETAGQADETPVETTAEQPSARDEPRAPPAQPPAPRSTARAERTPQPESDGEGARRPSGGTEGPPQPAAVPAEPSSEPAEPATVSINAIPWAEVELDGKPLGTTPLFGVSIAPGAHELRFRNEPMGAEREMRIELSSGDRRKVVVDLQ